MQAKRASSIMFVFNEISDTYVYICGRMSSYMRILNSSLLGKKKLCGQVVHNVVGVKCQPLSQA